MTSGEKAPAYRMYVDENGNHDMQEAPPADVARRYLCLTGVVISMDHVKNHVGPELAELKSRHFGSHPDDRVVLHRREMLGADPPFHSLRDPARRAAWDEDLLTHLDRWDYKVITAVIDKNAHRERYRNAEHPYHYCLEVLVERLALEMRDRSSTADVMAEARGKKEDLALKAAFTRLQVRGGSALRNPTLTQQHLTSKELKLKRKGDDVPGLQIADVVGHAAFASMLAQRGVVQPLTGFEQSVAAILTRNKWRRGWHGGIEGFGRKWLP